MSNDLESALSSMGMTFSDSPEDLVGQAEAATPQEGEQPTSSLQDEPLGGEEVTEGNDPVVADEPLGAEGEGVEPELDAPQANENIEPTEELSSEDLLMSFNEILGTEANSIEELRSMLEPEQNLEPTELDPQVKAIADFVQETGRSVNDWFTYQSFNPSEMDDMTVMTAKLKQDFPDMSNEEAQLLLGDKYKIDEDMYSENELRIGKLNLKMDAQKAREELNTIRESYAAPMQTNEPEGEEELESPITEEWVSNMSDTVDAIESLEFSLGGEKSFSFGMTDEYKSTLKDKNSKLDEFFDQYVDNSGNWDFDTLSAHRAIIDNIDSIAASIYAQGISDGQSKVVKDAINPSSPNPQGSQTVDAASAQDKVRQQVLNALRGGEDTMRIKF